MVYLTEKEYIGYHKVLTDYLLYMKGKFKISRDEEFHFSDS